MNEPSSPYNPEEVEREVRTKYPDLHLISLNGASVLRGSLPIEDDAGVIERYRIELALPQSMDGTPVVRELDGKIPRTRERHTNGDGTICWGVPEHWLLQRTSSRILEFLETPLRNFFLSQIAVSGGGEWPFGSWDHGRPGLEKAYCEMLGIEDPRLLPKYLEHVGMPKVNRRWSCFCESGARLRDCHLAEINSLRERIPQAIAMAALRRLKDTPAEPARSA